MTATRHYAHLTDSSIGETAVTQHAEAIADASQGFVEIAASQVTSGTFADARISESSVEQYSGWVLLNARTVDNFEVYVSLIDSTFSQYVLFLEDIVTATDSTDLIMRGSTDNGSSALNDGRYSSWCHREDGTTRQNVSAGTTEIVVTGGAAGWRMGTGLGEKLCGKIWIMGRGGLAAFSLVRWEIDIFADTAMMVSISGSGAINPAGSQINAFLIAASGGTPALSSGSTRLYGLRSS